MIPFPIAHFSESAPSIVYTTTKSLDLDGVDERVDFSSFLGNNIDSAYSISGWVKSDTSLGGQHMLFSSLDAISSGVGTLVWFNNSRQFFIFHRNASGTGVRERFDNASALFSNAIWNHYVATNDGSGNASGFKLYINGTNTPSTSTIQDDWVSEDLTPDGVYIGSRNNGSQAFDGHVYDTVYWDVELNSTEVTELYNSGTPIDANDHSQSANILFYARFGNDPDDDATGGTGVIKDRVGGFDGTPINTESGDIVTDSP